MIQKEQYKKLHLSFQGLTKVIGMKTIFTGLTCAMSRKHIVGVVGANGVGKSTIARILMGKMYATSGVYTTNGVVGYLPQELAFGSTVTVRGYMRNFVASREEYKIDAVLTEVGLPHWQEKSRQKKRLCELSGGQQRKIAIAKLLLQERDILILDEPTNHIDAETRTRLLDRMHRFGGMIVVISHDRALLQEVCDTILDVEHDRITQYDGNYDAYVDQKALCVQAQQEQFIAYTKRKKKMEERLSRIRQRASFYDSPALGKLLRSKEKYFEREIVQKSIEKPREQAQVSVALDGGVHKGKLLVSCQHETCGYEETIVINDICCEVRGTQKILLTGENGAGKSTLLRMLVDKVVDGVRVCYVDQHQLLLTGARRVLDEFTACASGVYTQEFYAKPILVNYGFSADMWNTRVDDLSYGQKVRLRFAQISTHAYDLLLLDEPTNHLDIPTRESLELALQEYAGAIILVSHDAYFVQQMMVDTIWEVKHGRLYVERLV